MSLSRLFLVYELSLSANKPFNVSLKHYKSLQTTSLSITSAISLNFCLYKYLCKLELISFSTTVIFKTSICLFLKNTYFLK